MDPRLRGRLDESDVVQDACLEATQRIKEYLADPAVPFFVWLRFLAIQRLLILHRRHLRAQVRSVAREVSLWPGAALAASSEYLATQLVAAGPSPSGAARKKELKDRLTDALDRMDPLDREVLTARHFEQLSNQETAHVLGVTPSTASTRYVRALRRLRKELGDLPGLSRTSER
jgi:RNA polymerase sigma-70 factor (ECF subfamily)